MHLDLYTCNAMLHTNHELKQKKPSIIENEKKDTFKRVHAEVKEHILENKKLESKI